MYHLLENIMLVVQPCSHRQKLLNDRAVVVVRAVRQQIRTWPIFILFEGEIKLQLGGDELLIGGSTYSLEGHVDVVLCDKSDHTELSYNVQLWYTNITLGPKNLLTQKTEGEERPLKACQPTPPLNTPL